MTIAEIIVFTVCGAVMYHFIGASASLLGELLLIVVQASST